ncbi:hypothetical protein ACFL5V_05655 [Fibrobacterota bacterium]
MGLVQNTPCQLTQFFGGNNRLKYRGNLSYEGASALSELIDISSIYPGTGKLFGNPAGTAYTDKLQIQTDLSFPGLGINTSTKKSEVFKQMIQDGFDGFLQQEGVTGDDRVDPEIHTDMAQTPGLDGVGISLRFSQLPWPVTLTGAFERMVDFQLELDLNDLNVGVGMPMDETDPASDSIKAKFNLQSGLALYMGLNRRGVGMAMEIPKARLKYGLAVHQYMAYWDFYGAGEINGFISLNQRESYFNLEGTDYTDDLAAHYAGYGKGSTPGFAFGINWQPFRHFGLDLVSSYNGTIDLGYTRGEHYILHAVDPDVSSSADTASGEEADLFDVGRLNLTKPTLTKNISNDIENITLKLPSRLGGSFYFLSSWFRFNIDYAWYYRNMVLHYDHTSRKTVFDSTYNDVMITDDGRDSVEVRVSRGQLGTNLTHKGAIGLQLWGLFFNTGVYYGKPIFYENGNDVPVDFMPILNMGFTYNVNHNLNFSTSIISLPMAILKTSIRYSM